MTTVEGSVRIYEPIDHVFQYASDWRCWSDWFEGVSDFRPTSRVVRGNGARFQYRTMVLGICVTVETEIRNFVENGGWTGVSTSGLYHKTHWIFQPSNGSTLFTYKLEYRLPVPLLKGAMKREWNRIIRASLQNLKQTLEE